MSRPRVALANICAASLVLVSGCDQVTETTPPPTEQAADPYKADRELIAGRLASCKIVSLENSGPVTDKTIDGYWYRTTVEVDLTLENRPEASVALENHAAKSAPVSWSAFTIRGYVTIPNQADTARGNVASSSGQYFEDINIDNPHETFYPATTKYSDTTKLHIYVNQSASTLKPERGKITTESEKFCGTATLYKNEADPFASTWELDLTQPPQLDTLRTEEK